MRINKRAIVLNQIIALLLFGVMFLSFPVFVEAELLSKWYVFIGGCSLHCLIILTIIKTPTVNIDLITAVTIIFTGYLLLISLLTSSSQSNINILSIVAFILLYFSFKLTPCVLLKNIDVVILSVCVLQACYGLMQYVGILHTYSVFKIIGSFDNPAGFAACLATGFPFCFSVITRGKLRCYFGIISLAIIMMAIILSGSRAGMIALIIVCYIYIGDKYYHKFKKYRKYSIVLFAVLLLAGMGLFFLKKDSAIGRILIWKNSLEMIVNKPILGSGVGAFLGNYMQYQANFFELDSNSLYTMLADNVTHPFNEYLLLIIEYGMLGFFLFVTVIFVVIKYFERITVYHLCLVSVGVFACFSYPLRYPFVVVLIAYSLTKIVTRKIVILKINYFAKTVGGLLVGGISLFLIKDVQFEYRWGKLVQQLQAENYRKFLSDYEKLYFQWNGDPMFLYNYAAILNRVEQYDKSNDVLNRCIPYFNNYEVQMLIADNYFELKQWSQAEVYYFIAHHMIPSKFVPLYKLMMLYATVGDQQKSLRIAYLIINKEIKIRSGAVYYIRTEAQDIINKYSNTE